MNHQDEVPEIPQEYRYLISCIEKRIKLQIDSVNCKLDGKQIKNVIFNTICALSGSSETLILQHNEVYGNTELIVEHQKLLKRVYNILVNRFTDEVSPDLDTIIFKIDHYIATGAYINHLSLDPDNDEPWRRLVRGKLNKFMLEQIKCATSPIGVGKYKGTITENCFSIYNTSILLIRFLILIIIVIGIYTMISKLPGKWVDCIFDVVFALNNLSN